MADDFDPYYQWLGISPKHQPPSHYRLSALEEFESNADVIENAADQRMAHVRQFQSAPHGDRSQRLLNEITAAKLCLLNPEKRAEYDQRLQAEKDSAEPRRLKPFPRAVPVEPIATQAPAVDSLDLYQAPLSADVDLPSLSVSTFQPTTVQTRRRMSPQLAAIAGIVLGVLVVAAISYVTIVRNNADTARINDSASSPPETKVRESAASALVINPGGALPRDVWCEVLPWVDAKQDASSGQWQSQNGDLEAAQSEKGKVLTLPVVLEGDYRLSVEFTCLTPGNVEILIPIGDQTCNIELSGSSGIFWIDGRHTPNNGTATSEQPVKIGERQRAEIEVAHTADKASIRVAVDGQQNILWQGSPSSLSGWPTGGRNRPAIGAWDAKVRFHRVQVQLVSGKGMRLARPDTSLAKNREQTVPKDYVWLDDDVPTGAKASGNPCVPANGWEWVSKPNPVFSGQRSMRRSGEGVSQHYFDTVGTGLVVGPGDRLFAYIYLDRAKPPASVMLQLASGQGWAHRAFWGDDLIPYGEPNTPSRQAMGPLPKAGEWVRLEVQIERVGLKDGDVVGGLGFVQHGGTAFWDRVGLVTRTRQGGDLTAVSGKSTESVFLDELQEKEFSIAGGAPVGKRGLREDGKTPVIYQGKQVPHALAVHPPLGGVSYVVYALNGEFATLRATAALCDVAGQTQAHGPLTFKVVGDDKVLWETTRPIQALGSGEDLVVSVQRVKSLKLEVHCPARNGNAHAAWLMPALGRTPAIARPAGGITSLANPNVRFTVPEEHYAILRAGEVEAVVADNSAVDNDVLKAHRLGYNGVASLTHKARPGNLFVPAYSGLHFAFLHDGMNRTPPVLSEPRREPMELRVVNDHMVELYQKPGSNWALESAIRYDLLDDGVIEMTVECVPRQKTFANGYAGLYFTSYVDRPEAPELYFWGHEEKGRTEQHWVRGGGDAFAAFQAADDRRDFPHEPVSFASRVDRSSQAYDAPWCYGVSHGMACVQMFRRQDQVRFTQFPVGGDPGNPEWGFNWFIPNYEVGKLYRLVMRAMYVPMDALHLGLVEPHLRRLNGDAAPANPPTPKMAFLDDLTETAFKVGVGTLGKHGERGYTGAGVPDGRALFQGRNYAHALSTHPAAGDVAHVIYKLDGKFSFFRAQAVLMDVTIPVRTPVLFRAVADGRVVWTSAPLDRASVGQLCSVDIKGTKTLRLEVQSAGDNALQCAAWLNPLVSALNEPPMPTFSRTSTWVVEGTEFKFAESEKGLLLEMVPGTSKVYTKIQIPLIKSGQSWVGIGDLYFRSSPTRRYEAKVEVPAEDIFHSKSLKVRTICPDVAAKTKMADITSTWKKKE